MIRLDLHTHSKASPDGSLRLADYQRMLESKKLQCIAITDHDNIAFAMHAQAALGEQIIVGEEISTMDGELIGLYITERIEPGLSARATAEMIKKQHGLIYVPHPFETVRSGIPLATLSQIAGLVDIVEVHNGRAFFQNRGATAEKWAQTHHVAMAASSDAHGWHGWGNTATAVSKLPTRETLVPLLTGRGTERITGTVGLRGILYPKRNRLQKRLR